MRVKRPYTHTPMADTPAGINAELKSVEETLRSLNEATAAGGVYYNAWPTPVAMSLVSTPTGVIAMNTGSASEGVKPSTSGSALIIERRGAYLVAFTITANTPAAATVISVRVNGVVQYLQATAPASMSPATFSAVGVLVLNAGDTIDLAGQSVPNGTLGIVTASLSIAQVV